MILMVGMVEMDELELMDYVLVLQPLKGLLELQQNTLVQQLLA